MVEKVTKYKSKDGVLHDTLEEAEEWESRLDTDKSPHVEEDDYYDEDSYEDSYEYEYRDEEVFNNLKK